MAHPYFQEDDFVVNFEVELRRSIEEDKEKESIDRSKRRKNKKVSLAISINASDDRKYRFYTRL